jgi:hypothetical protein
MLSNAHTMDSQVGIGYMSSYFPGGAFVASLFIGLAIYEAMQDSTRAKRKALNKARNHIDTIEKFKEFINAQGQCCDIPSWVSFQEVASPLPDHCLSPCAEQSFDPSIPFASPRRAKRWTF